MEGLSLCVGSSVASFVQFGSDLDMDPHVYESHDLRFCVMVDCTMNNTKLRMDRTLRYVCIYGVGINNNPFLATHITSCFKEQSRNTLLTSLQLKTLDGNISLNKLTMKIYNQREGEGGLLLLLSA